MKKKHLILIGIILLLAIGLSGCNGTDNRFSGSWEGYVKIHEDYVSEHGFSQIVFSDNDAYCTQVDTINGHTQEVATLEYTYKTEGDKLILTDSYGGSFIFSYRFENENGEDVLYLDGSKFTKQ